MKRMKHAELNGLLAAATITLAGCVPREQTPCSAAALEHCSDFHYKQPLGVAVPLKSDENLLTYDHLGPLAWINGDNGRGVRCDCVQSINFSNAQIEFMRAITNDELRNIGQKVDTGDHLQASDNNMFYEFQMTNNNSIYQFNLPFLEEG